MNAPSVDAVFYNYHLHHFYFIQITISIDHPINYLQVNKLANNLGITDHSLIDVIYLVPQNVYNEFEIQKVENAPQGVIQALTSTYSALQIVIMLVFQFTVISDLIKGYIH